MAECFEEEKVKMGMTIISEGDSGMEPLYIVLDGVVDIYKGDALDHEVRKGGVFGEKHLLETDPFDFTALARSECTLLSMRKEELLNLMSNHIEMVDCWIDILNEQEEKEEVEEIVDVLFA